MYTVLLYYKIVSVQHPDRVVKMHKEVCKALQLKGRILIGKDGINGTVAGSAEQIRLYKEYTKTHRLFKNIDFKESVSEENPFPKLQVKVRDEIITTETREQFNLCQRGNHVDRDTFHQWLVSGEDMVLLDMRNDYEWEIGRFVNSVRPPMKYFRDLKDSMDFYEQFKGKKIIMFCTGGIRCEPASAYFIARGFDPKDLYQLEGGIVKYAEKYGNEGYYEGKCFVFDDRMAVPVGDKETRIVGSCYHCEGASDTYRNCLNRFCNKLFIGCDVCTSSFENTCSSACKDIVSDESAQRPLSKNHVMTHRNK